MKQEDIEKAIQNYLPKEVIRYELGGDYYYKCPWISCDSEIKSYYNFCPKCGQRLLFEDFIKSRISK